MNPVDSYHREDQVHFGQGMRQDLLSEGSKLHFLICVIIIMASRVYEWLQMWKSFEKFSQGSKVDDALLSLDLGYG